MRINLAVICILSLIYRRASILILNFYYIAVLLFLNDYIGYFWQSLYILANTCCVSIVALKFLVFSCVFSVRSAQNEVLLLAMSLSRVSLPCWPDGFRVSCHSCPFGFPPPLPVLVSVVLLLVLHLE
jgi:hypothetical protein